MHPNDVAVLNTLEFGQPGEFREWIVGEILSGRKRGSTNLEVAYRMSLLPIPAVGEVRALVDSTNRRVALVRYSEVVRTSSAAITEHLALREAESVEAWRAVHRDYWMTLAPGIREFLADDDWQLTDDEPAISTAFELVETIAAPPSLAFIGAGFHASTNLLPAAVLGGIRIEALATRSLTGSRAALTRFGSDGVPYDDASDLLQNPAIDRVVVVAQPADQVRLALAAIAAGKNVLVEKPLGYSAAEARRVADAAESAGVSLNVAFMKRHAPVYRRLKALIDDGTLGRVRSFQLTFGCDSTPFCATEEDYLKLAAIHVVDLVRFLFGEVVDVHTVSGSDGAFVTLAVTLRFESGDSFEQGAGVEPGAGVESGVIGTLDLTGLPSYSSETELLRVVGDHGIATVTDVAQLTLHTLESVDTGSAAGHDVSEQTTVFRPAESAMSGVDRDLYLRGFVGELQQFAAGNETSTGRDNVLTMELCDRILAR
jgi:UDP-N-acetylglucosamine 3-dehydrogenase